jgi:hypothetical protein
MMFPVRTTAFPGKHRVQLRRILNHKYVLADVRAITGKKTNGLTR